MSDLFNALDRLRGAVQGGVSFDVEVDESAPLLAYIKGLEDVIRSADYLAGRGATGGATDIIHRGYENILVAYQEN